MCEMHLAYAEPSPLKYGLPGRGILGDVFGPSRFEDMLACDAWRAAAGTPITLGTVEAHLARLRAHPPECGCGLCTAANHARPLGVFLVVDEWARGVAGTRRRAAR